MRLLSVFTATRSRAPPQARTCVTPGCFTDSTRTLTVLPPPVVNGCPITLHSETSSARMSSGRRLIGKKRSVGSFDGSSVLRDWFSPEWYA